MSLFYRLSREYRDWIAWVGAVMAVGEPRPAVYDERPDDIYVCSHCHGNGEVFVRKDFMTGRHEFATCPRCQGSGWDPAQMPGWAKAPAADYDFGTP